MPCWRACSRRSASSAAASGPSAVMAPSWDRCSSMEVCSEVGEILGDVSSSLKPRSDLWCDAWCNADLLDPPVRISAVGCQEAAHMAIEDGDVGDQAVRATLAASEPDASIGFA